MRILGVGLAPLRGETDSRPFTGGVAEDFFCWVKEPGMSWPWSPSSSSFSTFCFLLEIDATVSADLDTLHPMVPSGSQTRGRASGARRTRRFESRESRRRLIHWTYLYLQGKKITLQVRPGYKCRTTERNSSLVSSTSVQVQSKQSSSSTPAGAGILVLCKVSKSYLY